MMKSVPILRSLKWPTWGPTDGRWYYPFGGTETKAGVRVSEENAIKYLTVFACVSLVAGDIGWLPLLLYQRLPDGGKRRVNNRLADILHTTPNQEMSAMNWKEASQAQLMLWGNTYSQIERGSRDEVIGLHLIPDPGAVSVGRLSNGELQYSWTGADGRKREKSRKEILHIPGFGFNGLVGKSLITIAREAIGMGLAVDDFGATYFGKGTHPSALVTLKKPLGSEIEKPYIKSLSAQHAGLGNAHTLMVLQNDEAYQSLTISPEDSQFLQTRNHQKIEICGMYHVPPHKIAIHGANSNYNNLEQENTGYVMSCLIHWAARWEQQIALQLLTPQERMSGFFTEFKLQALLRGDQASRAAYYKEMFGTGSMSPNDIRKKENDNPVEGGDQYFIPVSMIPMDQAGVPYSNEPRSQLPQETREAKRAASLVLRDRLINRYKPLFRNAIQGIVNREALAIKKKITRERKNRSKEDMSTWLDKFYADFPEYVRTKFGPTFTSYAEANQDMAIDEIHGTPPTSGETDEFNGYVAGYIDNYTTQYVDGSNGQLQALLEEDNYLDAIETRVDEWVEKKADKQTGTEVINGQSAVYNLVAFAAGASVYWRNRGESCPYCRQMEGKKIGRSGAFLEGGGAVKAKDADGNELTPMKVRNTKQHPQLHQGCDCYTSVF